MKKRTPSELTPAFPIAGNRFFDPQTEGMTLRDYFAGQALTAMGYTVTHWGHEDDTLAKVASTAYRMADAMLDEREK